MCGTTEAFLGSQFTRALNPLFSSGLGSFRQLLYFRDSRQSVGTAAKYPRAVTTHMMALFSFSTWQRERFSHSPLCLLLPPPDTLGLLFTIYILSQSSPLKCLLFPLFRSIVFDLRLLICFPVSRFCTSREQYDHVTSESLKERTSDTRNPQKLQTKLASTETHASIELHTRHKDPTACETV